MSPREFISAKPVEIDGVHYPTRTAAYRAFGVNTQIVWQRLAKGLSLEQAIKAKPAKFGAGIPKTIELCGCYYRSITQASNAVGIKPDTVKRRLARGWSNYQAFGIVPPPKEDKKKLKSAQYEREIASGVRECKECKTVKRLSSFPVHKNCVGGRSPTCRSCKTNYTRLHRYGITSEEYTNLFEKQGGMCAICKSPFFCKSSRRFTEKKEFNLAVDHCHDTGAIRGLLCYQCNVGIGKFQENLELLRNAVEYMERFNRETSQR